MNGFQKEYWVTQSRIFNSKLKYYFLSLIISISLHMFFLYSSEPIKVVIFKIVIFSFLILGILEAVLKLPSFYIERDKKNEFEVRLLMIIVPLIIYILIVFGWFTY